MIRCVLVLSGGEIAEGCGETRDEAFDDAYSTLGPMNRDMWDALPTQREVNYYHE